MSSLPSSFQSQQKRSSSSSINNPQSKSTPTPPPVFPLQQQELGVGGSVWGGLGPGTGGPHTAMAMMMNAAGGSGGLGGGPGASYHQLSSPARRGVGQHQQLLHQQQQHQLLRDSMAAKGLGVGTNAGGDPTMQSLLAGMGSNTGAMGTSGMMMGGSAGASDSMFVAAAAAARERGQLAEQHPQLGIGGAGMVSGLGFQKASTASSSSSAACSPPGTPPLHGLRQPGQHADPAASLLFSSGGDERSAGGSAALTAKFLRQQHQQQLQHHEQSPTTSAFLMQAQRQQMSNNRSSRATTSAGGMGGASTSLHQQMMMMMNSNTSNASGSNNPASFIVQEHAQGGGGGLLGSAPGLTGSGDFASSVMAGGSGSLSIQQPFQQHRSSGSSSSAGGVSLPSWDMMFAELVRHKAQHGHCIVTKEFNPRLAAWVRLQRAKYHEQMMFGTKSSGGLSSDDSPPLSGAQIGALQNLGFDWNSPDFTTLSQQGTSSGGGGGVSLVDEHLFQQRQGFQSGGGGGFGGSGGFGPSGVSSGGNLPSAASAMLMGAPGNTPSNAAVAAAMMGTGSGSSDLMLGGGANEFELGIGPVSSSSSGDSSASQQAAAAASNANNNDAAWNERYLALRRYQIIHGHCMVPARYTEDPRLGHWVMTQRRQYHLLKKGRPSSMTPERIQRLNMLGFAWSIREEPSKMWDLRYAQLKRYCAAFGDCLVPQRFPPNPPLGTWVNTQRRHYKLMKDGKHSSMTPERVEKLEKIGFVWSTTRFPLPATGDGSPTEGDSKETKPSLRKESGDSTEEEDSKGRGADESPLGQKKGSRRDDKDGSSGGGGNDDGFDDDDDDDTATEEDNDDPSGSSFPGGGSSSGGGGGGDEGGHQQSASGSDLLPGSSSADGSGQGAPQAFPGNPSASLSDLPDLTQRSDMGSSASLQLKRSRQVRNDSVVMTPATVMDHSASIVGHENVGTKKRQRVSISEEVASSLLGGILTSAMSRTSAHKSPSSRLSSPAPPELSIVSSTSSSPSSSSPPASLYMTPHPLQRQDDLLVTSTFDEATGVVVRRVTPERTVTTTPSAVALLETNGGVLPSTPPLVKKARTCHQDGDDSLFLSMFSAHHNDTESPMSTGVPDDGEDDEDVVCASPHDVDSGMEDHHDCAASDDVAVVSLSPNLQSSRLHTSVSDDRNGDKTKDSKHLDPSSSPASSEKQLWLCDVCKVQSFDSYAEACLHEASCRNSTAACKNTNRAVCKRE